MNKVLFLGALVLLFSCKKPVEQVVDETTPTLNLSFLPVDANGNSVLLNEAFSINDSVELKISDFAFYVTELEVQSANGEWNKISEGFLVSQYDNETRFKVENQLLLGAQKLRFNVGVPANINNADPSTHKAGSVYAITGTGMHWGWETGYKFLAIDGYAKLPGSEAFSQNVSLHVGTNELLRQAELDISFLDFSDPAATSFIVTPNMAAVFNNVDLATENQSHTSGDMITATKIIDNFVNNLDVLVAVE